MKKTLSMALAAMLILLALAPCALADGDAPADPLPLDVDEALSELHGQLTQSQQEYRLLAIQKRLTDIQNTRLLLENAQLLARIASLTEELNTVQAQLDVMTESYNANFDELADLKDDLAYARKRVSSLSNTVSNLQQYKEDLTLAQSRIRELENMLASGGGNSVVISYLRRVLTERTPIAHGAGAADQRKRHHFHIKPADCVAQPAHHRSFRHKHAAANAARWRERYHCGKRCVYSGTGRTHPRAGIRHG